MLLSPTSASELPSLRVSVSFLVNYEPCSTPYDWIVGVHGIIITFVANRRTYSATYLPEVALEHKMTKDDVVEVRLDEVRRAGAKRQLVLGSNISFPHFARNSLARRFAPRPAPLIAEFG